MRRQRRNAVWIFALQLAALDVLLRGPSFYMWHPRALLHLLGSAIVLRFAASFRSDLTRMVVALMVAFLVCFQIAIHRYYHVPFDAQVAMAARHSWADVRPVVLHALPVFIPCVLVLWLVERRLVQRAHRLKRRRSTLALAAAALALGGPLRDATTEVRAAHAAMSAAIGRDDGTKMGASELPPLVSSRVRPPNVLFLLTESVRASDFDRNRAPEVHALFEVGVHLREMRALASYTALSLSALLTGLPQTGSRDAVLRAPDLFDYAHAWGSAHYWSAHSETVFEKKDVRRSLASFITADTMLGHPIGDVEDAVAGGLDRRLARECELRFPTMHGPYLAMAHFSGTHAPYFFDEERARFVPFSHTATWSNLEDLHRAYENAIAEQDRSLAACARAFIATQGDAPWLIVLTSDHGEAFGEHAAIHHGQNLYEEQIHVPAYVLWGNGALEKNEEDSLRAAAGAFLTHLDLVPTVLDAMGILDHLAIASDRARMPGRSLLRPLTPMAPLPITNCSEMFPCPLSAWGVLHGDRELFAQPWDHGWKCLALPSQTELPPESCDALVRASRSAFPTLPNGKANR